jgi:hypothetical protein
VKKKLKEIAMVLKFLHLKNSSSIIYWGKQYFKMGQGKPTARISANVNELSATSPPAGTTLM